MSSVVTGVGDSVVISNCSAVYIGTALPQDGSGPRVRVPQLAGCTGEVAAPPRAVRVHVCRSSCPWPSAPATATRRGHRGGTRPAIRAGDNAVNKGASWQQRFH